MLKSIFKSTLLFLLLANLIYGGGFQINEHGARGMAMAGAFTALALDPSAIYYNPAGLVQLKGFNIMFGSTLILPKTTFRGVAPAVDETKMVSQVFYPINFYATYRFNKDLAFGLGVNNPYGMGTKWDDNWIGRYITTEIDLKTFFITPTVAYSITDDIMVGAGFDYVLAEVTLKRKNSLAPFTGDAAINLKGTGKGIGFRAGVLTHLTKCLSAGVSFRSSVKLDFDGTAETVAPSQMASKLPSGAVKTGITTPMSVTAGLAYKFTPDFVTSFDFQYVGWSSYDKLKIEFTDKPELNVEQKKDYQNSFIARLGAEYNYDCNWTIRGGLLYDKNPVKDEYVDPMLPDSDRMGLNLGVGVKITKNLSADLSYLFLRFSERTVTTSEVKYTGDSQFIGTYNSSAQLIGFNLTYNF